MSDWIEWKGGECPVPEDTAVAVHLRLDGWKWGEPYYWSWAHCGGSKDIVSYRVINQHRIDAARLEGIRLGLEAAHKAICALPVTPESDPERVQDDCADSIAYDLMINIDTIAREAVLDRLAREAQADNMGYDND